MAESSPIRVDIVSDVVCPWCIVGFLQLQRACNELETGVVVYWHPFELNPDMPPEGQNLREHLMGKYGISREDSEAARAKLIAIGAELGFSFAYGDDMRMPNTFRAHQLIHWAGQHGQAHQAKQALFAAHFTDGRNVDDLDVLENVAASLNLDGAEARRVLETAELAETVRKEQAFWTEQGISGVPTMVFDGKFLVTGAQGPENYARILEHVISNRAA